MTAATLQQTLTQLTTTQLRRLEKVLLHLDRNANCKFDEVLAQLSTPHYEHSQSISELIQARAYALTLEGLDFKLAQSTAQEEFESGKLRPPPIPRYRPKRRPHKPSTAAPALGLTRSPADVVTTTPSVVRPSVLQSEPLPTTVVVFKPKPPPDSNVFHSKCFYSSRDDNSVW
jgi:hypothetical protein